MKTLLIAAVAVLALAGACSPAPGKSAETKVTPEAVAAESSKLTQFLDAEFEKEVQLSPERLTNLGRKEQYDKLDDYSEAGEEKELAWRRQSVADMKAQFDRAKLDAESQTSYDMWLLALDRDELQNKFRKQQYVFGFSGPHTDIPNFLINDHKVEEKADMDAYIARLGALSVAIDQVTARAKAAADDGVRIPKFQYERTIKEAQAIITGAPFGKGEDSPLWADAVGKIKGLVDAKKATPEEAAAMTAAAMKALKSQVKPAYERLGAWLKADAEKAPSGKVGALTLPDGPAFYEASLKLLTTTDMTPQQIHELGLKEVERIHGEMDAIRQKVGFKGDLKAFFEFMRKDKQFYLPNTDAGRAEYLKRAQTFIDGMYLKLPTVFNRLPKAPLVVKRVEPFREVAGGAAHYMRPAPDGSQPGVFYSHLIDMNAVALWALEAVVYHEGVPGHHMQIAIAGELTGLPKFRTQYNYTAYVEGWGLYAEGLAKEMGFYTDPYMDFGRLSSELWRAVRLVDDTGIHAMGWTEEEAVKWAMENSPRPEQAIRSEVRRFILWPGQATAYKIGALKILELREKAKTELGDKFDIKGFHDTVIGGGALPLPILEKRVDAWVAKVKGA
ncbi:MAG TPA: DUF885 domain-containing protein [Hyphomonadaceae bacterium]|nr:DUF885 domain-containing protein [Hyphomonadaceae bacterium]